MCIQTFTVILAPRGCSLCVEGGLSPRWFCGGHGVASSCHDAAHPLVSCLSSHRNIVRRLRFDLTILCVHLVLCWSINRRPKTSDAGVMEVARRCTGLTALELSRSALPFKVGDVTLLVGTLGSDIMI